MIQESFIVRSSISSQFMKRMLFKGFALAFLGVSLLSASGIFIPLSTLQKWGWILFLISLGLITLGLLPYRRLSQLQLKPSTLVLIDANSLAFFSKGKKLLTLPLQSIFKMSYVDHPTLYGIVVWLKPNPLFAVTLHVSPQEVEILRRKAYQIEQADLFFPYFSQRTYREVMNWLSEEKIE